MKRGHSRSDPTGVGSQLHHLARSGQLDVTPLGDIGEMLREQLRTQSLPSWCNSVDWAHGGLIADDRSRGRVLRRSRTQPPKRLVAQTRLLWVLSHAHYRGLAATTHDLLTRASDSHRFIHEQFYDRSHGGYFWEVERSGRVRNDFKSLYGQAFAIYALVEFSRASGDSGPLHEALALWKVVMDRLHDHEYGGWWEHAAADWSAFDVDHAPAPVGVLGRRSANAHLHLVEALSELAEATGDSGVIAALEEAVGLLSIHFYPPEPTAACHLLGRAWGRVDEDDEANLSLGHNVEFGWLLVRAERHLGRQLSIERLTTYLDHALASGFDAANGGMDSHALGAARGHRPRLRNWWVQAELLVALAVAFDHAPDGERFELPLRRHLGFILAHQVDPLDGLWWYEVDEFGGVTGPFKRHYWKAGYHEVRAMITASEILAPPTR